MAQFLGTPKVQYFDSNGDPLSGGLLYTYVAGTTTDKATYPTLADAAAGTNANANPVVLDARGEANVVLNGTTKLVLKDSGGTTIWTVDSANNANITNDALADITDVTITSIADDDLLTYDSGTGKWINESVSEAGLISASSTTTFTNKTIDTANNTITVVEADISDLGSYITASSTDTLTNKTLTTPIISSISNSGTITVPTGTDTLVGKATTDTLTNKTLTAPVISSISNSGTVTIPTGTDTLVGRATTDTLTNKTINTASNTITVVEADISDLGSYITASSTDTLTNKTIDANGTGNSLSNIDVADLANGTDGELITWDAAGAPTTVAVGTSGHVLTSNGAGAAPTFQATGAAAQDWVLVASATASDDATIDFTSLSSTYIAYKIIAADIVPASDAVNFYCRVGTGAGPTYDSGSNYDWTRDVRGTAGALAGGAAADTEIELCDLVGTGTGEALAGEVTIYNPSSTAGYKGLSYYFRYRSSNTVLRVSHGDGQYVSTTAVTALRFLMSSGNISSGEFRLYGLKAS